MLAPSSYEAERVILRVEYSRIDNRTIANTEVVTLTATIASANVTGLTKFESVPEGGAVDGIIDRGTPGGSEVAILRARICTSSDRRTTMRQRTYRRPFDRCEGMHDVIPITFSPH